MNYTQLLLVVVVSVLYGATATAIATPIHAATTEAVAPPTILSIYFYRNCSGEPASIFNLTVGECGENGVSYHPSNDGLYVYMFQTTDYVCNQSTPVYSYIIRYDTLPVAFEGWCQQYVVTHPESAPSLPLPFPPAGWWQEIAYLNTTGQPATSCAGPRSTIFARDPSVCRGGRQAFCDGATQVGAAFKYAPGDDQCQGVPLEVEQESLEGCFDGALQICPSGNTIPSIPSALSVVLINYDGTTCGDYDNNTIINAVEGVCIQELGQSTGTIYDCNLDENTINVTTYQRGDCSDTGSSVVYPLGSCEFNEKNQYFLFYCDAKPTHELVSKTGLESPSVPTATSDASNTVQSQPPQATLSWNHYSNSNCTGEPTSVENYTIGACDESGGSYYVSPDGQYVYRLQTAYGCLTHQPIVYSSFDRMDTLPQSYVPNDCQKFVVSNPQLAPELPIAFPPQGWLQTIYYLNETDGTPGTNCTSPRTYVVYDNSTCISGQQQFCDGSLQVNAIFLYQPNDTYCQDFPIQVQLSDLATGCSAGEEHQFCPSGNTIPPIPTNLAIEMTQYGGESCGGNYTNTTLTDIQPGVCIPGIQAQVGTSIFYECDLDAETITVTQYGTGDCSGSELPPATYPLNECVKEPNPVDPNFYNYYQYTCNFKPIRNSHASITTKRMDTGETGASSLISSRTKNGGAKKRSKKKIILH